MTRDVRTVRRRRWLRATLTGLLLAPALALAHGGEPHGSARTQHDDAPGHAHTARRAAIWGTGDHFEVLLKHGPAPRGEPMELELFVADAQSNAPVEGAEVSLTLVRDRELLARAKPSELAGRYVAEVQLPGSGEYEAVASVGKDGHIDLVTLGAFEVATPEAAPKSARWMWAGAAAVLLLGLASLLAVLRRGRGEVTGA